MEGQRNISDEISKRLYDEIAKKQDRKKKRTTAIDDRLKCLPWRCCCAFHSIFSFFHKVFTSSLVYSSFFIFCCCRRRLCRSSSEHQSIFSRNQNDGIKDKVDYSSNSNNNSHFSSCFCCPLQTDFCRFSSAVFTEFSTFNIFQSTVMTNKYVNSEYVG